MYCSFIFLVRTLGLEPLEEAKRWIGRQTNRQLQAHGEIREGKREREKEKEERGKETERAGKRERDAMTQSCSQNIYIVI